MEKTVCFTGHRVIPDSIYAELKELLLWEIERQIHDGAAVFRTGGALGFDTLAALCVLSLKKTYPGIRLELFLPCPTQTRDWTPSDAALYEQILALADAHRYVSDRYYPGILQARNRALVDGADVCIAYLLSSHGGGTAYTSALAIRTGLEFVNLADSLKHAPDFTDGMD